MRRTEWTNPINLISDFTEKEGIRREEQMGSWGERRGSRGREGAPVVCELRNGGGGGER